MTEFAAATFIKVMPIKTEINVHLHKNNYTYKRAFQSDGYLSHLSINSYDNDDSNQKVRIVAKMLKKCPDALTYRIKNIARKFYGRK